MSRKFLLEIEIAFTNATSTSDANAIRVRESESLSRKFLIGYRDRIRERDIRHPTQTRIALRESESIHAGLEAGLGTSRDFTSTVGTSRTLIGTSRILEAAPGTSRMVHEPYRNFADPL